eukprot:CAMPEP_0204346850 /NCGR_PEP_ID=MMETSP0469-20131031/27491_1 /ASSEMBLY_ACC=CAM_ASM_000384 /TAXON_ID=2969 /ORGANISM="Oxyrrhis marina" /LENGTH=62 /DNA_ID=CAMNT_0051332535 /DNA_START=50 /DNA_END=235 /DNA_ORIENTATION=-
MVQKPAATEATETITVATTSNVTKRKNIQAQRRTEGHLSPSRFSAACALEKASSNGPWRLQV